MNILTRRNAMRGMAAAITGAIAVPATVLATSQNPTTGNLAELNQLIERWETLENNSNAQSKLDSQFYDSLKATEPPVPELLLKPILKRDGTPADPFTDYIKDNRGFPIRGYRLDRLQGRIKDAKRCLKQYGGKTDQQSKDIVAHQSYVLPQAIKRLKLRKWYDKAWEAHWAIYDQRERAWEAMVDEADDALQEIIAFPITSPEALERKAAFFGNVRWFTQNHNYETVHKAALALVADVARVAEGQG